MELLIVLIVVGAVIWAIGKAACGAGRVVSSHYQPRAPDAEVARRRQQEATRRERLRKLNAVARALQLSLLQVRSAPDFRRASSFAAHAKNLPVGFRQRQFRRFRPLLLRHFIVRLRAGTDPNLLLQSLRELAAGLAIAPYEADYIAEEAQRSTATVNVTAAPATYAQRLAQLQREHEERMAALRNLRDIDAEMREQLLEAQQTRFREALQELAAEEPAASEQRGTP